jgi:hypothetical protein
MFFVIHYVLEVILLSNIVRFEHKFCTNFMLFVSEFLQRVEHSVNFAVQRSQHRVPHLYYVFIPFLQRFITSTLITPENIMLSKLTNVLGAARTSLCPATVLCELGAGEMCVPTILLPN